MLLAFFKFSLITLLAYLGHDIHITPNHEALPLSTSTFSPMTLTIRDVTLALEGLSDLMRYSCTLPDSASCLNTADILDKSVLCIWDVNKKIQTYSAQLRTSINIIGITFQTSLSVLTRRPSLASFTFALIHDLTGLALYDYRDARNDAADVSLRTFDQCILDISRYNARAADSSTHLHNTVDALIFTIDNHFEDGFISLETFFEADLYLSEVRALVWDIKTELYALQEQTDALQKFRLESSRLGLTNWAEVMQTIIHGTEALMNQLLGE